MPTNRTKEINEFKKANYKRINLDLRITPKENELSYNDVVAAADSLNISKTELIKRAVSEYIKKYKLNNNMGGSTK